MGFIDSMQFTNSSLDSLVKNLSDNDFGCLSEEFSSDLLKLSKEKGVYPYGYMNSIEKFSEDKLTDDKCKIFSSLKDTCSTENDYFKAVNMWNVFKMNTMDDCHNLYLKTDVLLLAGVFEKFISICLDYYELVLDIILAVLD